MKVNGGSATSTEPRINLASGDYLVANNGPQFEDMYSGGSWANGRNTMVKDMSMGGNPAPKKQNGTPMFTNMAANAPYPTPQIEKWTPTYTDFTSFMEQNPNLPVVEMDTVKGARGSHKVLLTMIFRQTNFMLVFLMPDGTQKSVKDVFDKLTLHLGIDTFRKLFPVILTDNGVEFKGSHHLEYTENGARRTRVFYCDPQASWQKGRIEKNHVILRQVLPKGFNFNTLEDEDIHLIICHVNSVVRELFENNTPFDLMQTDEQKKLLETLALSPIPLDEVCLKPKLLKRKK